MTNDRIDELRLKMMQAYRPDKGYAFSHVLPFAITKFHDSMAWNGLFCAACLKVGDTDMAEYPSAHLQNLVRVGKDARNYAPADMVPEVWGWHPSATMSGFLYKRDPQDYAGPIGLMMAKEAGLDIDMAWVPDRKSFAKRICSISRIPFLPSLLFKHDIFGMRQHVNTMVMCHILADKRLPTALQWLAYDNPLYKYICCEEYECEWMDLRKCADNHETVEKKEPVLMKEREPDIWPAKNWPYKKYMGSGDRVYPEYVPICELTARYLQMYLKGETYG